MEGAIFEQKSKCNIQLPRNLGNSKNIFLTWSHASTQFICVLGAQDPPAPELFTAEFVTDISDTPIVIEVPLIFHLGNPYMAQYYCQYPGD